jgi:hypothetical protein
MPVAADVVQRDKEEEEETGWGLNKKRYRKKELPSVSRVLPPEKGASAHGGLNGVVKAVNERL